MGNYKFRFSDMIPNAWFYKLRDMNKKQHETLNPTNKKHSSSSPLSSSPSSLSSSSIPLKQDQPKPHLSEQRKSYYFTRDLAPDSPIKKRLLISDTVEPPRKSSRRRRSIKRNRRPPQPKLVSGCSCGAVWAKPEPDCYPENSPGSPTEIDSVQTEYGSDRGLSCSNSSCNFRAENDILIDITDEDRKGFKFNQNLAPIITKKNEPTKIERTSTEISERNKYGSLSVKVVKENILTTTTSPVRRFSTSPGVKLRTNSPRIGNLRSQGRRARRSVSESFAVVKSSKDPRRDFRESMVEMIVENNIRASKDLEELLACYLSLNSDEYHDLIVNVFKQIWFDFIHLRLK